mmetsp:Transcript_52180/g.59620  ORF Transcript_52180/g.59620 Transcript_52180/m.59620 type:complete len:87 (+) Transcript_52180:452-712(+)
MDSVAKQSTRDSALGETTSSETGSLTNSSGSRLGDSASSANPHAANAHLNGNMSANADESKPRTRIKFSNLDLPNEELGEFKKTRK